MYEVHFLCFGCLLNLTKEVKFRHNCGCSTNPKGLSTNMVKTLVLFIKVLNNMVWSKYSLFQALGSWTFWEMMRMASGPAFVFNAEAMSLAFRVSLEAHQVRAGRHEGVSTWRLRVHTIYLVRLLVKQTELG